LGKNKPIIRKGLASLLRAFEHGYCAVADVGSDSGPAAGRRRLVITTL